LAECNLLTKCLSVIRRHHVLEDSTCQQVVRTSSKITLVTHFLPVAILRTCRVVNAETAPFVQAKLDQLLGVRYMIGMQRKIDDVFGGLLLPFFIRCLLAGSPGRASDSYLNESLA
jgi:hypothetical protein